MLNNLEEIDFFNLFNVDTLIFVIVQKENNEFMAFILYFLLIICLAYIIHFKQSPKIEFSHMKAIMLRLSTLAKPYLYGYEKSIQKINRMF